MIENGATVTMRDVKIIFRNFSGEPGPFNQAGTREFGVLLPEDVADAMAQDGWNVKTLKPREDDEDDNEQPWLPVAVGYKVKPPKITLATERGLTNLGEKEIGMLDWADITKVDLIIAASHWEVNDKSGVKAYVRTMFVTIEEDELEREYAEKYAELDEARE